MWSCQILSYKQDCRHVCKPTFSDAVRRGKSISRYVLATCMVVVPLFTFYFMFQFCLCFHYTRPHVQIICLSSPWIKYQLWVSVRLRFLPSYFICLRRTTSTCTPTNLANYPFCCKTVKKCNLICIHTYCLESQIYHSLGVHHFHPCSTEADVLRYWDDRFWGDATEVMGSIPGNHGMEE